MNTEHIKVERIALREWLMISCLMLLLTAGLAWMATLNRIDLSLYDRFMQANSVPARDDIIIVGIDDYSLTELGKWPWPRARHAELLQQLSAAKPLAIGLDVFFPEAEPSSLDASSSGDQQLAAALSANNLTVLPVFSENAGKGLSVGKPIPALASAARQLSHIHLELDKDGVARSVFLREGMNGEMWPHMALAMKDVAHKIAPGTEANLPGARLSAALRADSTKSGNGLWQRDYQMHIPFYGSSGHFKSVPYVAVLRGEVPADFFKNKYVLIGPTAVGMADSFPTPVSANEGMIAGIEIHANILASLLDGRSVQMASNLEASLYCLCPVLLAMLAYLFLSPRLALLTTFFLFIGVLAASYLAMRSGLWLPPAAALVSLMIAYPLWSWRRLEAAIRYLGEEFILLDNEPHLLPELKATDEEEKRPVQDRLEQRIDAMQVAARRVRDLRQFVSDSLSSLPDATLVTTTDGNVLLSNQIAKTYFASIGVPQVNDALVPYLFAKMNPPQLQEQLPGDAFSWWNLLDLQKTTIMVSGIEVVDPRGRDLLIKSAPCYSGKKELVGWIVSLINITAIRAAERSRDETLHFISHDMRAPQASILALLELQQDPATALPQDEFLKRIEKASRITLGLADNFVQLARAESQNYHLEDMDFQDVLLDASEEMWTLAKSKHIKIVTQIPEGDYPVRVDRALMTRALTNLLSNGIKYSPSDTTITCSLEYEAGLVEASVICTIKDQGYGIARVDQPKLFQRFQRFKHGEQPKNDGVGLGMVFVKAVIDHHHGQISFVSAPNEGTTFHIKLPAFSV
ncbi:CHASE2 domain-containing protein [Undibacterium sp. Rencai35W]|uniref:CHASE2 domain-containing protein n=1 Tax=Undibacterium sp. Rencai35W TaxID=3413046 RepID=UPI003BF33A00